VSVGGGETVKGRELDKLFPGLATVTLAVPAVAMSLAGIEAVNCVPLTKVVERPEAFHLTVESFTKLEPFTVRVKAGPPELAEVGLILVSAGTTAAIASVNCLVAVPAPLSLTRIVNEEFPGADGVPLRTPVEPASARPAGSDPAVTDQL
jgi:hypothetical protein